MSDNYNPRRNSRAVQYTARDRGSSPQRGDYPRRMPPRKKRRRGRLTPKGMLLLLVLLVVIAALLVFFLSRRTPEPEPDDTILSPVSSYRPAEPVSSPESPVSSQPAPAKDPLTAPAEVIPQGSVEKKEYYLQIGNTGFEYFRFNESASQKYITTVSKAGELFSGAATVYDLVIPTAIDVKLSDSFLEQQEINSQDQRKVIEGYLYPSVNVMNPDVKTVSVFDALKLHNNDYLYFRTDRQWTQLGAYYAYVEFCKVKGIAPVPLEEFDKREYPGFLGSYYQTEYSSDMESDPDTVEAYLPRADAALYADEEISGWPVILDGTDYSTGNKNMIFIAYDQPYEEIVNDDLSDGSSCLVVKDSYANAFVPFLVNHYETIYVVDYRLYSGSVSDLVSNKGIRDVLILTDIASTSSSDRVSSLAEMF